MTCNSIIFLSKHKFPLMYFSTGKIFIFMVKMDSHLQYGLFTRWFFNFAGKDIYLRGIRQN
jgi:hypothetical protein